MKLKRMTTVMLSLVMVMMSIMTVPAFAQGNDCSYGLEYQEVPMVRKTDAYGKTIYVAGNVLNNKVFPLSQAPEMKHTKTIGNVTFSNYIKHSERTTQDDAGIEIKVNQVYVGLGASMRSDVDNVEFMYSRGTGFNSIPAPLSVYCCGYDWPVTSDLVQIKTNTPCYRLNTGTPWYDYLDYIYVRPYTNGGRNNDGTWKKGLTWVFEENPDKWGAFGDSKKYMAFYPIRVEYNGTATYYQVVVTNDTNFSGNTTGGNSESKPNTPPVVTYPAVATANPTTSPIYVNGVLTKFDAYNINGNNYFKLRDVALVLRGTEKQFEVAWDPSFAIVEGDKVIRGCISMTSLTPYTTVGGEMKLGDGIAKTANLTTSPILKDGKTVKGFTGYNINGNNYFKLRDIGIQFDFDVTWDGARRAVIIDTTKSYTED